jgi:hypothetical protein
MGQDLLGRQQVDHAGDGAKTGLVELPAPAGVAAAQYDLHDLDRRLVALLGIARDLALNREIVIEQSLSRLRLFRQAKADLHLAVGQRKTPQQRQPTARAQPYFAEHSTRMVHEVAPDLVKPVANAVQLAVARGEEQPRVLETAAGKHHRRRPHRKTLPI